MIINKVGFFYLTQLIQKWRKENIWLKMMLVMKIVGNALKVKRKRLLNG